MGLVWVFSKLQEMQLSRLGADNIDKDNIRYINWKTYYWVGRQVNRHYRVVNIKQRRAFLLCERYIGQGLLLWDFNSCPSFHTCKLLIGISLIPWPCVSTVSWVLLFHQDCLLLETRYSFFLSYCLLDIWPRPSRLPSLDLSGIICKTSLMIGVLQSESRGQSKWWSLEVHLVFPNLWFLWSSSFGPYIELDIQEALSLSQRLLKVIYGTSEVLRTFLYHPC